MTVEGFLSAEQEQQIIDAIRVAESSTSGEIRVHLEAHHGGALEDRAHAVFHMLKMDNTRERNGVLVYIAVQDHAFHIMGDSGIDAVVPDDFWDRIRDAMQSHFKAGQYPEGIIRAIQATGGHLAQHFPWQHDDINELDDSISRG